MILMTDLLFPPGNSKKQDASREDIFMIPVFLPSKRNP